MLVCVPIFAGAVSREMLQQETESRAEWTHRPPFSVRFYAIPSAEHPMTLEDVSYTRDWVANMLERRVGLPIAATYVQAESSWFTIRPGADNTHYTSQDLGQIRVGCVEEIGQHIQAIEGHTYGSDIASGLLSAWVLPSLAEERGLQIGETYSLEVQLAEDVVSIPVTIAGFWEALDPNERYWYHSPYGLMGRHFLVTSEQYQTYIAPLLDERVDFAFWYFVFDDSKLDFDRADHYIRGLKNVELEVAKRLPGGKMDYAPLAELERGQQRKNALSLILLAFSMPLVGILIFFVASVSRVVARFQSQEIAMLASRGSSRAQIVGLALAETIILLAIACPLGVTLSLCLARILGHTESFLTFVPRAPLHIRLAAADWRYIGIILLVCIPARLIPAWVAASSSIVQSEREMARKHSLSSEMRLVVLAALLTITLYAYRRLSHTGPLGLLGWQPEGISPADPLLVLAPSLFFFAMPLLAAELFALLMRPLAWVGRFLPSPVIHLACLNLGREGGQYRVPVFLLVLCLSSGIFYASLAKSADEWLVERLYYQVGTDLSFEPGVEPGRAGAAENLSTQSLQAALVLHIDEYRKLAGVSNASRVADCQARISVGETSRELRVLGIDRLDFPKIVYYRPDFSSDSLGTLMNRLGASLEGVLLPNRLASSLVLQEGDHVLVHILIGDTWHAVTFEVVGLFDYFPTMYEEQQPLAVINLEYLEQQTGGLPPHKIWLRLEPEVSGEQILDEIKALDVLPLVPQDACELVLRDQERLERVGIFGVLSLCFLAGALLAAADLLVYYLASIRGRAVRFGILQAIGMLRAELLSIVSWEYVAILAWGMLAGAGLGVLGARLYVPFFPLTENPQVTIPPFLPLIDWDRAGWIAAGMGTVLAIIGGISLVSLARTRLFEVLRLGVRE